MCQDLNKVYLHQGYLSIRLNIHGNNLNQIGLVDIKANDALVSWKYRIGLVVVYAYIRCSFQLSNQLSWDLVDKYLHSKYSNEYTRYMNDVWALMLKMTGCLGRTAMNREIIYMG